MVKWVLYELQSPRISRTFASLPDSVAVGMGMRKPEPPSRAVVASDEQGQVMESKPHPGRLVSLVIKKKNTVFVVSLMRFLDSGRNNIIVQYEGIDIDEAIGSKEGTEFVDEPCRAAIAHRCSEERRRVGDD